MKCHSSLWMVFLLILRILNKVIHISSSVTAPILFYQFDACNCPISLHQPMPTHYSSKILGAIQVVMFKFYHLQAVQCVPYQTSPLAAHTVKDLPSEDKETPPFLSRQHTWISSLQSLQNRLKGEQEPKKIKKKINTSNSRNDFNTADVILSLACIKVLLILWN